MIEKAIILVAGLGTRLRPRTLKAHKCMTKVNGVPIIQNALDNLSAAGIVEVTLVTGYLGNEIRAAIGAEHHGMRVRYTVNERYDTTNTSCSLKIGLGVIDDFDSLYILEGDVFFEKGLFKRLQDSEYLNATLLEPYNPQLDGTFVTLGKDGFVTDWTHKSMREDGYRLDDKLKTINIHRFDKAFVENNLQSTVDKLCKETQGTAPLENVMRDIVRQNGHAVYGLASGGLKWFEIDDENDLKTAEKIFA